jgi:hypothetical protein
VLLEKFESARVMLDRTFKQFFCLVLCGKRKHPFGILVSHRFRKNSPRRNGGRSRGRAIPSFGVYGSSKCSQSCELPPKKAKNDCAEYREGNERGCERLWPR